MRGCVAVFDLGKTNIKVLVFDAAGKVVAERDRANAPLAPDANWPYLQARYGRRVDVPDRAR